MSKESHDKFEEMIDQELKKLPDLEAPPTLIPRVLAAIEAQTSRPWWLRPWLAWPLVPQVASLALVSVLGWLGFAGAGVAAQHLQSAALPQTVTSWTGAFGVAANVLDTLLNALWVVWRSGGQLWLLAAVVLAFAMYLACVGIGTACVRIAIDRR